MTDLNRQAMYGDSIPQATPEEPEPQTPPEQPPSEPA
jgi:hypothetical protein